MTGDVRDRVLGLLSAGPASVARLAAGLGVPGGVVSYELKLLERDGLVRVGTTRREHGVPTPVWVSTAAAAPPALRMPVPIPGLTWIGDEPYPTPLWTVPQPHGPAQGGPFEAEPSKLGPTGPTGPTEPAELHPAGLDPAGLDLTVEIDPGSATGLPATAYTGIRFPTRPRRPATGPAASEGAGTREPRRPPESASPATVEPAGESPRPPRPRRFDPETPRGPRLHDMRRVPMDDATFYEFAERLSALAQEFAARATPGSPAAEVTILLTRPDGDATSGYGYGS
ncbi:helix-turn-helix domain-containing protein [Actinoplanes sp. NPDC051411]|uniref:helix-turn-helix domain-containing protein n=1 Tax=Actinoplanes sp. NPDC051411 TaxID=3155522 RepID=UPI003442D2A0